MRVILHYPGLRVPAPALHWMRDQRLDLVAVISAPHLFSSDEHRAFDRQLPDAGVVVRTAEPWIVRASIFISGTPLQAGDWKQVNPKSLAILMKPTATGDDASFCQATAVVMCPSWGHVAGWIERHLEARNKKAPEGGSGKAGDP